MKSHGKFRAVSVALIASAAIMLSGCGITSASKLSETHLSSNSPTRPTQNAVMHVRQTVVYVNPTAGAGYLQRAKWFGNQNAWAVGFSNRSGQGNISQTHNGGRTWVHWDLGGAQWQYLFASSARNLWVWGDQGLLGTSVAHTVNGGHTWTVWRLRGGPFNLYNVRNVLFPAVGRPYFCVLLQNGGLLLSKDLSHWHSPWPHTQKVTAMAPGSSDEAWVALTLPTGEVQIKRGDTVGATWRWKTVWHGSGVHIQGFDWLSSRIGWFMGNTTDPSRTELIQITTDGGSRWRTISTQPVGKHTIYELRMQTERTGWAAAGEIQSTNFPYFGYQSLLHTTNGGRIWRSVPLPSIAVHYKNPNAPPARLAGFFFAAPPIGHRIDLWFGLEPLDIPHTTPRHIWSNTNGNSWISH